MRKLIIAVVVAASAAAAYALPADLVVTSPREVRPDEGGPLYYLGPGGDGFLYNGSSAALSRVAPYRLLDRDARARDYYIVWVPGNDGLTAAAFERFGTAARLSADEFLVGVEVGFDAEELRAVERRAEFVKLEPVTPRDGRVDAETPPTEKDAAVEASVATITSAEYAGYIQGLQDFVTRYTTVPGYVAARDYLKTFFEGQGLQVTLFPFEYRGVTYHNVVAERAGKVSPDEIVIICGHFDSTSDRVNRETLAPGADDNASGVAAAMAAARAFKEFEFGRTVRYIGFGGEEQGLYGSRAYAQYCYYNGANIIALMNADMVAYDEENGGRDDFSVAHGANPWLLSYLSAVGGLYGNNLVYDHEEFNASDHYYFWAYGYPAVAAIEGEVGIGGGTDYPFYHTIYDTVDKLHPDLGVRFARDYAATLAHLAGARLTGIEEGPGHARGRVPRSSAAVRVYPNPWRPSAASALRFEGLATPAQISIYDLSGRRVASWAVTSGADSFAWEPATSEGGPLTSGVYIYRVEAQDQSEAGKIVIVR
jgi:hypothetical protein